MLLLIFFLSNLCESVIKVHSPDELRDLGIPYGFANFGNPALSPKYGRIQYDSLSECKLNVNIPKNTVLVLYWDNNCILKDILYRSYSSGANLILILASESDKLFNITASYYTDDMYEDFTALVIPFYIYSEYFSKYKNVWISYEFDYKKSNNPQVELILSGNRNQEAFIVKGAKTIVKNYKIAESYFKINIAYTSTARNTDLDCIEYQENYYCAHSLSSFRGKLILENLLTSLTFYKSLPKVDHSLHIFIEYLQEMYTKCGEDYDIDCNINLVIKSGGLGNIDMDLLLSAKGLNDPDSHLVINGKYFPWWNSIESGYCLSYNQIPSLCPKCSTKCYYEVKFIKNCISDCNTTSCGYSNMECLISPLHFCYYFMLNDGNCNSECSLEEDCSGENNNDSGQENNESSQGNSESSGNGQNTQEKKSLNTRNQIENEGIVLISVIIPSTLVMLVVILYISKQILKGAEQNNQVG
ncbi:hypothetical protein SteCoe_7891 [Stentor coeruleus]|uniref:Uncharacterized protein n=1 Tax=Stentor coeruleus TaxID=5963 RepID=A0A1R2CLL1_9CILI|nr:hypothetical protein SteCoe_7891 [Stentor coeruleus]